MQPLIALRRAGLRGCCGGLRGELYGPASAWGQEGPFLRRPGSPQAGQVTQPLWGSASAVEWGGWLPIPRHGGESTSGLAQLVLGAGHVSSFVRAGVSTADWGAYRQSTLIAHGSGGWRSPQSRQQQMRCLVRACFLTDSHLLAVYVPNGRASPLGCLAQGGHLDHRGCPS